MATNTQTPRHKLTIIEDELILELASVIVADGGGTGVPGEGDMLSATYDPQGIEGDAFDMANMTEGADAKVMTAAERASIAALGTASTREADQDLRTTDAVEFDEVTAQTVNLHTAAFDTTNGGPTTLGEMAWDSVDGTLDIQADGGVKIAVGEDGMIRVRNTSGGTIAKGAPLVYAGTTGASGKLEVGPWIGANVSNVRTFLGFAAGEMANNTDGYAVWFGKIKEIPTDGGAENWQSGQIIYAIPGASATLSNVAPTSGDYVTAAVVINAGSGTSGILFSRPTFDTIAPTLATVATSGDYGDLLNRPALVVNFGDLGDAATVDLPTINTPLGTALSGKAPLSHTHTVSQITDFPTLANIATSGSWNDLSDVPLTFAPSAHTHVVADITDFPTLATVATSGAYSDLSGTPTIPSDSQVTEYLFDDGVHALTSTSGVVTPNALDGVSQKLTLSENISSFNTPTNLGDGQSMLVQISNSAYTFSLNPSWELISGTPQQVTNSTRSRLAITRFGNEYWISIESQ